ncbi:MAG TPA: hypothetical protein VD772_10150, partial [Anseongella sp.]|nr:hypothetical protein [Anseongella sp.]
MKGCIWPAVMGLFLLAGTVGFAQCPEPQERVYAGGQTSSTAQTFAGVTLSEVIRPQDAVDNDVTTSSTLSTRVGLLAGIEAWQNLRFTGPDLPAPGTPVTVKLGFGSSVLDLLGGITVQATLNGNPVGTAYTGSDLLGLLGGTNRSEITFTPNTAYNGVRASVKPTLGLGVTADLYHAYFLQPAAGPVACNEVVDILSGVGTFGVNAVGLTGSVTNEWAAVDGNTESYSEMSIGVQALSYVQQTVVYSNPSKVGDSIRVVLSDPGGLLELELLTNFQIQPYLGDQPAGPLVDGSSDLLDIDLLGLLGSPGTKVAASFAPPGVQFDRIQIRLASIAGLLAGIRVHEIGRAAPKPILEGTTGGVITICAPDPLTLTITDPDPCAVYHWFDAAAGGAEITQGLG